MARMADVTQIQEELVRMFKLGDEAQVRSLMRQLGSGPRQVRAALETMLTHTDGLVRQAAAFGLGELGGAASVKRLEAQLAIEEARGDYDGAAVVEDITRALGRINGAKARASLVKRLERLVAGKPELADVNDLAEALWRKRHPDLIPAVRASLEKLTLQAPHGLHGLLTLLEKSPEELDAWVRDSSVSLAHKRKVLAVAEEDVPDELLTVMPAFIATAQAVSGQMKDARSDARTYCERLFSVLLQDRDRFVGAAPEALRSALRALALEVIVTTYPDPSLRAATILELVGRPEDAAFLTDHCPEESVSAKVFRDAARALRERQKN
ncbi:hypothetical protein [Hyalangium gracile]|uniref:hypothetical protein n=1 Tax=Hyalangium gracile TaxID=394092 RepID=UPI001CCBC990|nr:hypothetical protein [Hyalangium gracile]